MIEFFCCIDGLCAFFDLEYYDKVKDPSSTWHLPHFLLSAINSNTQQARVTFITHLPGWTSAIYTKNINFVAGERPLMFNVY